MHWIILVVHQSHYVQLPHQLLPQLNQIIPLQCVHILNSVVVMGLVFKILNYVQLQQLVHQLPLCYVLIVLVKPH